MHLRQSDKTLRHEGEGKSNESVEIQAGTEKRPRFGRLELIRDLWSRWNVEIMMLIHNLLSKQNVHGI